MQRPATQIQAAVRSIQKHHTAIQQELRLIERLAIQQHGSTGKTDQSVAKARKLKSARAKR